MPNGTYERIKKKCDTLPLTTQTQYEYEVQKKIAKDLTALFTGLQFDMRRSSGMFLDCKVDKEPEQLYSVQGLSPQYYPHGE